MLLLMNVEGGPGVAAGLAALRRGAPALDAVEAAIRPVEADPEEHSVGLGGWTNLLGRSECDASIMDGRTRVAGAVAGLEGFLHPISVAREVMRRLPHVLLVGEGAGRFAGEIAAERAEMVTPEARAAHGEWIARLFPGDQAAWPPLQLAGHAWASAREVVRKGTVICLAVDAEGEIAAGVSSSGWAYKYPGRVGDSGVIGAGIYADARYGACGCTHTGERTIRAGTARAVVLHLRRGASVEEACREAARDLRDLTEGVTGPVVLHAIDRSGNACVLTTHAPGEPDGHPLGKPPRYLLWRHGEGEPEARPVPSL